MTTKEKFLAELDNLTQRTLYFSDAIEEKKVEQATEILNGMEKTYISMQKSGEKFSFKIFIDYIKSIFSHTV